MEIPTAGTYYIYAYGARGGNENTALGGSGAFATGSISLTSGSKLIIVVGQKGKTHDNEGGGGGGTFVFEQTTNSYSDSANPLLMVAGGGGGAGKSVDGQHGSEFSNGGDNEGEASSGGSGNNGGSDGNDNNDDGYGGFGLAAASSSFIGDNNGERDGGFGGGGGGNSDGGGGGGGYNGGGGGKEDKGGGGGGSFVKSSMGNKFLLPGFNLGRNHGLVYISDNSDFSGLSFTQITSGYCTETQKYFGIYTQAMCDAAASALSLGDTSSDTQSGSHPLGCYKDASNNIHVNTNAWTTCASEDAACSCIGKVRYGAIASGVPKYHYKDSAGSTTCSNGVFGDPVSGTAKTCECLTKCSSTKSCLCVKYA
jgi:hypothetical protein